MKKRKRLLLSGASGFLGQHICRVASEDWDVFGVFLTHTFSSPGVAPLQGDLCRREEVEAIFQTVRPHAVVHAAAMSDINACEKDPVLSQRINVDASFHMATLCRRFSIPCIFTSTDLVFGGEGAPYGEEDQARPINEYGRQKAAAEQSMMHACPDVLICRLPLLFGPAAPPAESFLQPSVRAMKAGMTLKLFVDEFRTPLYVEDAARALLGFLGEVRGTLHLGGPERISRYDLGVLLADILGFPTSLLVPTFRREVNTAAPRPWDVSLNSAKALEMGFFRTPLEEALRRSVGLWAGPGRAGTE